MEEERKKEKKKKTARNCKSPTQRQRFITTIKSVTEGKKSFKSLIKFHSANKTDNYNKGDKEKEKRNPKESTEQVKM